MVFQGGAFYIADGLSWNLGQGADVRRRLTTPTVDRDGPIGMTPDERQRFNAEWLLHVPLKSIDVMNIREYAPGYFAMLEHPSYDAFWTTFDVEAKHHDFETPAFHVHTVDTLGAGDVFHGAFALAITEGQELRHALRFASAAAALKCTRFGGAFAAPQRVEVEEFLRQSGAPSGTSAPQ